jgi:lipoate---protein ligase
VVGPCRAPVAELLADGVRLLDQLEQEPTPTLRWARASDTVVVMGRGQEVRLEQVRARAPVPVIGRMSGGGAVWVEPSLVWLDVLIPAGHAWLDGDLSSVFLAVGRRWAGAMGDLGVPNLGVHEGPAGRSPVCYATLGRGEVTAGGRKLVGLSQRRRRPGALVQCGLLRRWDPGPLLAALGEDPSDTAVHAAAVGLDELLAPAPDDAVIRDAVTNRFRG